MAMLIIIWRESDKLGPMYRPRYTTYEYFLEAGDNGAEKSIIVSFWGNIPQSTELTININHIINRIYVDS